MQGWTAYPPNILQKTFLLFIFNDVEEDSFAYRGDSLCISGPIPDLLYVRREVREKNVFSLLLSKRSILLVAGAGHDHRNMNLPLN